MRATADNYIADCAATTFDEGEESAVPETDADAAQEDAGVEDAPEAGAVDNTDADITDEVTDAADDRTEE
jgi:hypothetical protein